MFDTSHQTGGTALLFQRAAETFLPICTFGSSMLRNHLTLYRGATLAAAGNRVRGMQQSDHSSHHSPVRSVQSTIVLIY